MTVLKLSSSKKQLQVITDDGTIFGTSVSFAKGLLEGRSPHGFILMTKMPFKVSKSRFAPSPVYNPTSGEKEMDLTTTNDSFSQKSLKANKEKKAFIKDVTI